MPKLTISATTIVEPTGVPYTMDIKIPRTAHTTDILAEQITTDLKFLNTRIADNAGKITSADIRSEPTRFIARTMITATITAMTRL